jgi:hypothetical protein
MLTLGLTIPFTVYRADFRAEGKVVLLRGTRILKTYSAESLISIKFKPPVQDRMFTEPLQAAYDAMWARLINQMVADHDLLSAILGPQPESGAQRKDGPP